MKITIGRGNNRNEVVFATGKRWDSKDSETVQKVLENAGVVFAKG